MNTDLIKSSYAHAGHVVPLDQMREAEDWTRDCLGLANETFVSYRRSYLYVKRSYPGGWSAFIAECCTLAQI